MIETFPTIVIHPCSLSLVILIQFYFAVFFAFLCPNLDLEMIKPGCSVFHLLPVSQNWVDRHGHGWMNGRWSCIDQVAVAMRLSGRETGSTQGLCSDL